MSNSLIEIKGVSKSFTGHQALKQVSFEVPKGKIFGLLGPNGAGKTTLIRIINRITAPDEGSVWFNSEPMNNDHLKRIGYLPEERGLYKKMTVLEQLIYFGQLRGMNAVEARNKALLWMDQFEMTDWASKKVEELSKGMQQKVQFVVTVLHDPELIILDEPFSGFDPVNAEVVKKQILRFRDEGKTVIFSSHRMESVEELCDVIGIINRSEKLFEGSISSLREQHRTHHYEAVTRGALAQVNYRARSIKELDEGYVRSEFGPLTELEAMELLTLIGKETYVRSFTEMIPGMHELFVKLVQNIKGYE